MHSSDLVTVAAAVATIAGILLGLYLAMAGLIFQSVVSQATEVQSTAIELGVRFTSLERVLSKEARELLWTDEGGLRTAVNEFNRAILSTDFSPAQFDLPSFGASYTASSLRLSDFLDGVVDRAAATSHPPQGFVALEELAVLRTAFSQGAAQFERLARFYEVTLATWRGLKDDLPWTLAQGGLVGLALLVSGAASVRSLTVVDNEWVNVATAGVLLGGAVVGLARAGHRLRWVYGRF